MNRFAKYAVMLIAAVWLTTPTLSYAADWRIDPAHTTVSFKVRHLGVTWVQGEFQKVSGTVRYDPKNPGAAAADIVIDAASINTRNARRDNHLRTDDFLLVETHPTITFKSRAVRNAGAEGLDLVGDLTIRGVTKEVVLKVADISGEVRTGRGTVKMGASAATRINRKEFGVKYNRLLEAGGLVVGDEVRIAIDVELNKS
ncbi:MAG: YceI family protein [Nitrospinae bacterium]|nr:YceI family protein [Nitrospinota bacterium]